MFWSWPEHTSFKNQKKSLSPLSNLVGHMWECMHLEDSQKIAPHNVGVDCSPTDHKNIHILNGSHAHWSSVCKFCGWNCDPVPLVINNLLDGFAAAVEHLHLKNRIVAKVAASQNVDLLREKHFA